MEEKLMARNTSVTLGQHFDEFVLEKINEGRFQTVSEVVRAGLRKLEQDEIKLQALREKLQAGEDSPIVENFNGKQLLADLHKKHVE
jgi:antitoxin ParD1/3/4